tara:strand:+ start:316 stop:534 length:219 start_codon:yes stop_codon:yes gene_type:complete
MQDNTQYITADIGLAAFLLVKGQKLVSAGRDRNRYKFVFQDQKVCEQLAVEYVNSEYSRFDASLKNLKNLVN